MKRKENKTSHLKFLEPLISVAFLILMLASPLLFGKHEDGIDWEHILKTWRSFIPYLALFLVNRFVFLPFFLFRRKRWLYFIGNVVLIASMAIGVNFYRTKVRQPQPQENRREVMAPRREAPPEDRPPVPGERPPGPKKTTVLRNNPPPLRDIDGRPPGQPPPKQLPPLITFRIFT